MSQPRTSWSSVLGYAVGVGLTASATLGVYASFWRTELSFGTALLLAFPIGFVLGGAWALLRRVRVEGAERPGT